jgi:hypothetical protein
MLVYQLGKEKLAGIGMELLTHGAKVEHPTVMLRAEPHGAAPPAVTVVLVAVPTLALFGVAGVSANWPAQLRQLTDISTVTA